MHIHKIHKIMEKQGNSKMFKYSIFAQIIMWLVIICSVYRSLNPGSITVNTSTAVPVLLRSSAGF